MKKLKTSRVAKNASSSKKRKFYITTAIPYVNAKPHIGHALEFVQTDALARYHRLLGDDVFFLTGTDENGTKAYRAAQAAGIDTQKYCDDIVKTFFNLLKKLEISNDDFIRTTDRKKHWPGVQKIWELCKKDIVKRTYTGLYCVGCEAFVLEKDLVNGECSEHKKKPEFLSEENYFFLLSRYTKKLKKILESDKYRVIPDSRKNEILSLVNEGLQDISISRPKKSLPWGVPVPGDDAHMVYIWFDALSNYATGVGYGHDNKSYKKWWPCDVHVIGKGILRFHAAIWPGMLLSAGLPLPKNLFVHGYVTTGGEKISKSLGNVIDPVGYVERYGSDAVRHFLLAEIPAWEDGDFNNERFIKIYNTSLANELGNLLMRTQTLTSKYLDGKHPQKKGVALKVEAERAVKAYAKHLDAFEFDKAYASAWSLVRAANKYLNDSEPWKVAKTNPAKAEKILYNVTETLRFVSVLCEPLIPNAAASVRAQYGFPTPAWKDLRWGKVLKTTIKEAPPLFPKILEEAADPFSDIDLRVAQILDVKDHPDAERLYVLTIDLGSERRQLVAGLRQHYNTEELRGKKIVVVANLEHAKLRGVESQGMLLAADDGKSVGVLTCGAKPGTPVVPEGIKSAPKQKMAFKDFQKCSITARKGEAFYGERVLLAGSERVRSDRVTDGSVH